jgi:hypothetical protein
MSRSPALELGSSVIVITPDVKTGAVEMAVWSRGDSRDSSVQCITMLSFDRSSHSRLVDAFLTDCTLREHGVAPPSRTFAVTVSSPHTEKTVRVVSR